MRNPDVAVVARQDVAVDVAAAAVAVDAAAVAGDGSGDDAVVVLAAEGDNDEEIAHVQERHDDPVVGGYNSVDCMPRIDYSGKANAVDTES